MEIPLLYRSNFSIGIKYKLNVVNQVLQLACLGSSAT